MRKYYAERENILTPISFENIRLSFLLIYNQFFYDKWFAQVKFVWAIYEPELFIFRRLGFWDIWPFSEKIPTYDEAKLFSVIEFLHDYVYSNRVTGGYKDLKDGQTEYRNMVNDVLRFYNGGYELVENGEILKLSPLGLESLVAQAIKTNDPENIDLRVKYAILKFSRYNSSVEDKKDAVRTLGDVLEFFGKFGIKLNNKDDSDLFKIINGFDIRHHDRKQQSGYDKDIWYDWMFYTFLASIHVLMKLNKRQFNQEAQHTE